MTYISKLELQTRGPFGPPKSHLELETLNNIFIFKRFDFNFYTFNLKNSINK